MARRESSLFRSGRSLVAVLCGFALLAFAGCGEKKEKAAEAPAQQAQTAAAPQAAAPAPAQEAAPSGKALPNNQPPADKAIEEIQKASHGSIKTQKEIRLSDEVKKKWNEVQLKITDGSTRASDVVTIKVGSDVKLTNEGVRLKVESFVPDYAIADKYIESRSNEPRNPAALVSLTQGGKVIARGWVFKSFPEFNSYNNERFQLALVGPSVPGPAQGKDPHAKKK